LRITVANLALAALLWWGTADLAPWFAWSGPERALRLAGWIVAGAASYLAVLGLLGARPADLQAR
jgi:hypothetical protein